MENLILLIALGTVSAYCLYCFLTNKTFSRIATVLISITGHLMLIAAPIVSLYLWNLFDLWGTEGFYRLLFWFIIIPTVPCAVWSLVRLIQRIKEGELCLQQSKSQP